MKLGRNKRISNNEQPKIFFWSLLLCFVLCFFSYGYFVRAAIVNIVTRQDMEKEISTLSSKVISLESEYVKAKNSVTIDTAHDLGFVAVSNQSFIDRSEINSGLGLSLNLR